MRTRQQQVQNLHLQIQQNWNLQIQQNWNLQEQQNWNLQIQQKWNLQTQQPGIFRYRAVPQDCVQSGPCIVQLETVRNSNAAAHAARMIE
jgi:hypothetical protein